MEELSQILKNNRTDDLTWFCSLSESELDLLISLKKLVIRRAKVSGLEDLVADKFDLKMLRSLGLVLMEYVRKRVEDDTSLAPSVVQELSLLDSCNLLKTHVDDTVDIEEILTDICNKKSKKKTRKRLCLPVGTSLLRWTSNSERGLQNHETTVFPYKGCWKINVRYFPCIWFRLFIFIHSKIIVCFKHLCFFFFGEGFNIFAC
ncbi:hypothetical protein AtNW77_Chr4g0272321 [Arabidopsis thaliana]